MDDVELLEAVRGRTLTSKVQQRAMIEAVRAIDRDGVPGDIVECGVWMGGNVILARKLSPGRTVWAYDTFHGMTKPGPEDMRRSGGSAVTAYESKKALGEPWCAASLDEVKVALYEAGTFDETRLRFIVGDVCETLLVSENIPEQISLVRLDTDWYQSTKMELEILYPRLSQNGALIIDDYGHWAGCRKAVDEYFAGQDVVWHEIDYTAVLLRKP